jgi:hypothetical protein
LSGPLPISEPRFNFFRPLYCVDALADGTSHRPQPVFSELFGNWLQGRVGRCSDHLVDTFVVEPDGDPAWRKEDGNSITMHQGAGVIHLESLPPMKFNSKYSKRSVLRQAS